MKFGFFDREQKSAPVLGGDIGVIFGAQSDGTLPNYSAQIAQALKRNPYVYRCADLRASSVSAVDFILYDKDGNEVLDPNHPLRRLLSRPNPRMSWKQFAYETQIHLSLNGNAYILCRGDVRRGITELHIIPPDKVTPMASNDIFDPIAYYQVNTGQGVENIVPSEMIHIHGPLDSDQMRGVSPLSPAGLSIEAQTEARVWNTSMMKRGAKPSMTVIYPEKMNESVFQRALQKLRAAYGGADKAGEVAMFDSGATVDYSGFSAHDMDYTQGITLTAKEICLAMGVPPEKAGDSASKTYSNSQEASREFALNTIIPQLTLLYDALTTKLCKGFPDVVRIGYDVQQLEGMKADESGIITALTACDFLTTNEKRARLAYEDIPDGDVVLTAMGKVPLSEVASDPGDLLNDNREDTLDDDSL